MANTKMRVALSHRNRFVTQHLANLQQASAIHRQNASAGMAKIMETKIRNFGRACCFSLIAIKVLKVRIGLFRKRKYVTR